MRSSIEDNRRTRVKGPDGKWRLKEYEKQWTAFVERKPAKPRPPRVRKETKPSLYTRNKPAPPGFLDTLNYLFHYNPDTGIVSRRVKNNRSAPSGSSVGKPTPSGHLYVSVESANYGVHRIAWALHHGYWPQHPLDHINGRPADNRLVNIRKCTYEENARNSKPPSTNTSGTPGVSFNKRTDRWTAYISENRRIKHLGVFRNKEDACAARKAAEIAIYGEFRWKSHAEHT